MLEETDWLNEGKFISLWSEYLWTVREFFCSRRFKEVQTPMLVPSSGAETHLHPIKIRNLYLPTSPEFHLKRALVAGLDKIYEIKACFRDNENSPSHAQEFTMLEWYRANARLKNIKYDVKDLFTSVQNACREVIPFSGLIQEKTMSELFAEYVDFHLTPTTTKTDLLKLCQERGLNTDPSDSWNDLFHRIFINLIEPNIGLEQPIVVTRFPASQSALARINEDGWAERFEVYFRGLEIANAYDELTDPDEYQNRFKIWNQEKISLGYEPVPIDSGLIEALKIGMPPSGGIALGLERLFMAFYGISRIKEVGPHRF